MDIGTGLGALAFWGFLAVGCVAGIWYDLRRRQAQQETMREIVRNGSTLEPAVIDKLLEHRGDKGEETARDLKIAAVITLSIAPGLLLLGFVLAAVADPIMLPIMAGVAGLVGFIALGLFAAARIAVGGNRAADRTIGIED